MLARVAPAAYRRDMDDWTPSTGGDNAAESLIQRGWTVRANDGRDIGSVAEVGVDYFRVDRGVLSRDLYVPVESVANIRDRVVFLNLSNAEVDAAGWEQEPLGWGDAAAD